MGPVSPEMNMQLEAWPFAGAIPLTALSPSSLHSHAALQNLQHTLQQGGNYPAAYNLNLNAIPLHHMSASQQQQPQHHGQQQMDNGGNGPSLNGGPHHTVSDPSVA